MFLHEMLIFACLALAPDDDPRTPPPDPKKPGAQAVHKPWLAFQLEVPDASEPLYVYRDMEDLVVGAVPRMLGLDRCVLVFLSPGELPSPSKIVGHWLERADDVVLRFEVIPGTPDGSPHFPMGVFMMPKTAKPLHLEENTQRVAGQAPIWTPRELCDLEAMRLPKRDSTQSEVETLVLACEIFQQVHGRLPRSLDELMLTVDGQEPIVMNGDMLDGWDNPYRYETDAKGGFRIVSLGADGRPGGTGDAADIEGRTDK